MVGIRIPCLGFGVHRVWQRKVADPTAIAQPYPVSLVLAIAVPRTNRRGKDDLARSDPAPRLPIGIRDGLDRNWLGTRED